MFDCFYQCIPKGKKTITKGALVYTEYLFTFKCKHNNTYIVVVEEYSHFVFVVKYYLKAHRLSKCKYSLITQTFDTPRKIMTCIKLMMVFRAKNPFASFGFIGANMIGDGPENSKRFNLYKKIMSNFFSPLEFIHLEKPSKSAYLLLSRHNLEVNLKAKIEKMFLDNYDL